MKKKPNNTPRLTHSMIYQYFNEKMNMYKDKKLYNIILHRPGSYINSSYLKWWIMHDGIELIVDDIIKFNSNGSSDYMAEMVNPNVNNRSSDYKSKLVNPNVNNGSSNYKSKLVNPNNTSFDYDEPDTTSGYKLTIFISVIIILVLFILLIAFVVVPAVKKSNN